MTTLDDILALLADNTSGDISAEDMRTSFTSTFTDLAPKASPTFTGTVSGITKTMVGLGNVDNTSDANKPISTATQTALDAKMTTSTYDSDADGVVNAANQLRRSVYFQGAVALGDPVYVAGVNGAQIMVNKAQSSSTATMPAIGIATAAYSGGETGDIITWGALGGMSTGGFSVGDPLYVGTSGGLTNLRPAYAQFVGFCARSGGGDGVVGVGAQAPYDRVVVLTDAATIATNANLSSKFRVTLTASRTLGNPTNAQDGQLINFEIIEDGTGGWALTLDTKFNDPNGYFTGMVTTAGKRSKLGVQYNSSADKFDVLAFATGY